jgi:hypothetical protein
MELTPKPRFAILTLAIGGDFCRDLEPLLASKRDYATRHGYTYVQGGAEHWDRERPIAWSKIPFLLDFIRREGANYDYIWLSDADVYITNPDQPLTVLLERIGMPDWAELTMNVDSWGNVNSGNMLLRPTDFVVEYFKRVWSEARDIYHIWYENKAMIDVYEAHPEYKARIYFVRDVRAFNAYVNGRAGAEMWQHGDFLVHFAGVYDTGAMMGAVKAIQTGRTPRIQLGPGPQAQ